MLRRVTLCLGGSVTRKGTAKQAATTTAAAAAPAKTRKRVAKVTSNEDNNTTTTRRKTTTTTTTTRAAAAASTATSRQLKMAGDEDLAVDEARPGGMSAEREADMMRRAERMQARDLSGEVPVAAFALEILRAHPSVRDMGLRERMDFLCKRWDALSVAKRLEYVNDPLRGLM